ncbi:MAG TPA: N-acetylmuramoyl-L-alanine amidase [Mycobacteriales bacterium]|nr:N-acetylmuramoyl-L-alanine amidase [Mycobacteriales bacterium]
MPRPPALAVLLIGGLLAAGCTTARGATGDAGPTEPVKQTVATPPPPATSTPTPDRTPSHTAPRTTRPPVTHPRMSPPRTTHPPAPTPHPTPQSTSPAPRHTAAPAGRVVVLDPGHNGENASHPEIINQQVPDGNGTTKACNTTGTATNAGYPEHAFNWDVANRVAATLRADGITVVFTRPNDDGVGPCVDKRAEIGNAAHATAVVSIHGDGSLSGHGFHVIRAQRDAGTAATDAASLRLATDVHQPMVADSGMTTATYIGSDGYDTRSDLAGLTLSDRPTIMIECGNMRDAGDAARMSSPDGRARIAGAISSGISAFLDGR